MSGDSEAAPTYYFSGITFNPTFYTATTGNYLTLATAKNIFLTYPLAQGAETISTLYSSTIEASTSDFSIVPSQTTGILNIGSNSSTATRTTGAINIGTNVVGNTPIVIGMAGKSTTALRGTSVDVATKLTSSVYDSTNASTPMTLGSNLTTAGLTIGGDQTGTNGFIKLGVTQTTGTLEIASSATRTGSLFINSTTGATNSVYLGAAGTTTVIDGNTLTLGSASTVTTNKNTFTSTGLITATGGITIPSGKTLTANGGITISGNNCITLGTPTTAPTSTQLGYYVTGGVGFTSVGYVAAFPSGTALGSITSIPIGRYILMTSYAADTFTNIGTYFQLNANMTNGSCDSMMGVSLGQSASTGGKSTGDANGFVTITATSGTIALVGRTEASGTSVNVYITMRLIRIA